jgi:hypothetical protein
VEQQESAHTALSQFRLLQELKGFPHGRTTHHFGRQRFTSTNAIITQGQRSKDYVKGQHWRSTVHLVPFFGPLGLSEITAGKVQECRIDRMRKRWRNAESPRPGALHTRKSSRSGRPQNRSARRLAQPSTGPVRAILVVAENFRTGHGYPPRNIKNSTRPHASVHIKPNLDAVEINRMWPKKKKNPAQGAPQHPASETDV